MSTHMTSKFTLSTMFLPSKGTSGKQGVLHGFGSCGRQPWSCYSWLCFHWNSQLHLCCVNTGSHSTVRCTHQWKSALCAPCSMYASCRIIPVCFLFYITARFDFETMKKKNKCFKKGKNNTTLLKMLLSLRTPSYMHAHTTTKLFMDDLDVTRTHTNTHTHRKKHVDTTTMDGGQN